MVPWLIAVGFLSLLSQVVLLRELNAAFYGSELVYLLAFGIWMLSTALGARTGRRGIGPSLARVRWTFLAFAPLLCADLTFPRGAHRLLGGVPGADLPFPLQLVAMAIVLVVVGAPSGLLFRWTATAYVAGGGSLARAYALECAGGILGGAAATGALAAGVQNLSIAVACALAGLAAAVLPNPRGSRHRGWRLPVVTAVLAVTALVGLVWSVRIDRALARWRQPSLLTTRDTPYGRVSVSGSQGQIVVFENGALAFESQGTTAEEFVHLAALQHRQPRAALVLGGGVEGLVRELQQHPLERIDDVELDRIGFEAARRLLPPEHFATPGRAPVVLHFDDPRRFLERRAQAPEPAYDLILVGMPAPGSAAANRYYTREFFATCAAQLRPDGVLALRLHAAENLWTQLLVRRDASIHSALRAVFGDVLVVPGGTNTFIASGAALIRDPDSLVARLQDRAIRTRLVSPDYLRYLFVNDRFADLEARLAAARAPVNADSQPICYEYTLLLWLARFHPPIAYRVVDLLDASGRGRAVWLALPLVAALFAIVRRRRLARAAWIAGVAGFAGMVAEGTLLLAWQTRHGILYQDLGILITFFMGGMVIGAALVPSAATSSADRAHGNVPRRWGRAAWMTFAVLQLTMAALQHAGVLGAWLPSATLLIASGTLAGALFAVASVTVAAEPGVAAGTLYAADLIGGCVGALAASLFFLPMLGLAPTALVMACVAASALLLV